MSMFCVHDGSGRAMGYKGSVISKSSLAQVPGSGTSQGVLWGVDEPSALS